jgi:hypothetical protein
MLLPLKQCREVHFSSNLHIKRNLTVRAGDIAQLGVVKGACYIGIDRMSEGAHQDMHNSEVENYLKCDWK